VRNKIRYAKGFWVRAFAEASNQPDCMHAIGVIATEIAHHESKSQSEIEILASNRVGGRDLERNRGCVRS
jgi:hypothetical protein